MMGLSNPPRPTKQRGFGSFSNSSRACGAFLRQSVPSEAKDSNATVMRDKSASKFIKPNAPNSSAKDMHKVPSFGRSISASSIVSVLGKKRKPMEECKPLVSDEKWDGASKRTSMSYTYKQSEDVVNQKLRVWSKYFKPIVSPRKKVEAALNLFRELLSKRMREMKAESDFKSGATRAAYMEVAKDLQWERKWVNIDKRIGPVPGIEVGDKFECATELNVIGLHRQFQRGQGGNPRAGKSEPKDQKLERGNLALKNSLEAGTPVRVIRGFEGSKASKNMIYIYDGLYVVDKFTQGRGEFGKLVFEFELIRIPGQPKLTI
ncbi:hypothetical protein RGQ29_030705 [Quercus rubra]|uniref:YDG domain-containing protein n=1 Tax=Quercus rubra TaxID=3512 RepID=A0AAN7IHH8_QUERU|nr:hypothetical protein RGQ29_030705 [Quercus rubra]KAK4572373.1 hypothetical protein RGQ29_030705 [Quercus rubra]